MLRCLVIKHMLYELIWLDLILWVRRYAHEPSYTIGDQPWINFEGWAVIRDPLDLHLFVRERLKGLNRLQLQVLIGYHLILRSLRFFLITTLKFLVEAIVILFLLVVLLIKLKSNAAWSFHWLLPLVQRRYTSIGIWSFTFLSQIVCINSFKHYRLLRGKSTKYWWQRLTAQGNLRLHLSSFFLFLLQVRFLFASWRKIKLYLLVLLFLLWLLCYLWAEFLFVLFFVVRTAVKLRIDEVVMILDVLAVDNDFIESICHLFEALDFRGEGRQIASIVFRGTIVLWVIFLKACNLHAVTSYIGSWLVEDGRKETLRLIPEAKSLGSSVTLWFVSL